MTKRSRIYVIAGIVSAAIVSLVIIFFVLSQLTASNEPFTRITIQGVRDIYKINESVGFSAIVKGYGISCDTLTARIDKEDKPEYPGIQWTEFHRCASEATPSSFSFTFSTNTSKTNATISQTGTYILSVAFKDEIAKKEFVVVE